MSQMKDLYEKVSKGGALQSKFNAILNDMKQVGEQATNQALLAFAKEEGFDVSLEEMQEFFQSLSKPKEGELSELELDMVAGGKSTEEKVLSFATLNIGCNILNSIRDSQSGKDCTTFGDGSRY